ncbi:MAG: ROK family protein, partial [Clostridiales bacterium]|nr:ROK family protein [Clostridiales bacterium]
ALGEVKFGAGAGRGKKCVVMITLGTGVGGGIVIGGQVLGGARGIAGEIGHSTLYADGIPCACGKRGCLETYASTKALVRKAAELTGEKEINGRIIFARAAEGDRRMLDLLDGWMNCIAEGVSGLVHIFNPDLILIGGGVSAQEELLMKPLRKKILQRILPEFADGLSIERAALGNDAGLYGALCCWLSENGKQS